MLAEILFYFQLSLLIQNCLFTLVRSWAPHLAIGTIFKRCKNTCDSIQYRLILRKEVRSLILTEKF